MTDDPFDGPMPSLPEQLRARACPAGEPHTGDDPAADHGHTDCWLLHQAADRIDALEAATLRAYVPLATSTARQPYTSRIARNALAEVLGLPVVGVDEVGTTLDERDWIDYGVRQGWVTEACLTHDGLPTTDEEDEAFEDGEDPCQHVLRLWPDGQPPKRRSRELENGQPIDAAIARLIDSIVEEGTVDPEVVVAGEEMAVVGHEESTHEFVADGFVYRILRIDPVYGPRKLHSVRCRCDGWSMVPGPDGHQVPCPETRPT